MTIHTLKIALEDICCRKKALLKDLDIDEDEFIKSDELIDCLFDCVMALFKGELDKKQLMEFLCIDKERLKNYKYSGKVINFTGDENANK